MGLKDPTVLSAKPGSYLLFGPPARGNRSRLLAAVRAQSRNSIQAARGAGPVCSCQSGRWMCYLAANSSFPVGAEATDVSVPAPWPSLLGDPQRSFSPWQLLLCLWVFSAESQTHSVLP